MDISGTRQMLEQTLGHNYQPYLRKLRQWFANMITKERFDDDMRLILQGDALKLHNQLLLGILIKSHNSVLSDSYLATCSSNNNDYNQLQIQLHGMGDVGDHQQIITLEDGFYDANNQIVLDGSNFVNNNNSYDQQNVMSSNSFQLILPMEECDTKCHVEFMHRFPTSFTASFHISYDKTNGVQNDQTNSIVQKNVLKNPHLQKVFKVRGPNQPILSEEATLYGRFLVQAWKNNVDNVDAKVMKVLRKACVDHIRTVVTAIVKQRKSFRLQNGRYCHSIGAPYPNPYLLQGQHLFSETYSSDTAKLADVMQIPSFLPTQDEKERLAALEVAASVPLRYSHLNSKATLTDLLDVIQLNRNLIPNYLLRVKLCEEIFQKAKGYGDTYKSYNDEQDFVAKTVYPIIMY